MIRFTLCLIAIVALAIPAEAAPRRSSSGCSGDNCPAFNAITHPFQTIGNIVHHERVPQRLPEGPPAPAAAAPPVVQSSCGCASASSATARQGRFHIFPIFHGRQARGSGGCGCGR